MFGHDDNDNDNTTPVSPVADGTLSDANDLPTATPVPADEPIDTTPAEESPTTESDDTPDDTNAADNDLLSLKKQALEELTPLLDHLDQAPEEKFQTTLMMIQATDSPKLIQVAHDAAQKITDDKKRAEALLDIVNEINYFTQSKNTHDN